MKPTGNETRYHAAHPIERRRSRQPQYAATPAASSESSPETLLYGHGLDLIERLQAWADQLDQRQAELDARQAALERRERQQRLCEQQRAFQNRQQSESLAQRERELQQKITAAAFALGHFES